MPCRSLMEALYTLNSPPVVSFSLGFPILRGLGEITGGKESRLAQGFRAVGSWALWGLGFRGFLGFLEFLGFGGLGF